MTVCLCQGKLCNDWTSGGNVTTPVPVTEGSGLLCYVGKVPHYDSTECKAHQTMCSYLLNQDGEEILDCYDPTNNNGEFYAAGCYDNVSVEDEMGHTEKGKFCICDGDRKDLCNEDYMKQDPDSGASTLRLTTLAVAVLTAFFCTL